MRAVVKFLPGWRIGVAAFAAAIVTLAGCDSVDGGGVEPSQGSLTEAPAPAKSVKIVKPKSATTRETVVATGSIGSKQTSNIGPLVEGVVETIFVNVGDRVAKGDPLFRTRPSRYEREVDEAEANLTLAKANLRNARQAFDRVRKLKEEGYSSQSRLDDTRTALDVAAAEAEKREAELKTARKNLEDTTVRAPYDGVITRRFNDEGVYLSNVFRGGVESSVLQIQENHIVVAVVYAPEQHLSSLKLEQKALVYVETQPEPRESYVLVLNDMLDVGARTVELRLPIDNSDYALKSGQFARAEIFTDEKPVLSVPAKAVFQDQSGAYVLVSLDGRAEMRRVVAKERPDGTFAVLEGLDADDDVIVPNGEPVAAGDPVAPESV
ncbi:MAG: efflux RND transporter periplasmic adaptor subunit [Oricola sp.]|nr:efflux RND transporter periplasmic adaptor subunit [Oricola sp.]